MKKTSINYYLKEENRYDENIEEAAGLNALKVAGKGLWRGIKSAAKRDPAHHIPISIADVGKDVESIMANKLKQRASGNKIYGSIKSVTDLAKEPSTVRPFVKKNIYGHELDNAGNLVDPDAAKGFRYNADKLALTGIGDAAYITGKVGSATARGVGSAGKNVASNRWVQGIGGVGAASYGADKYIDYKKSQDPNFVPSNTVKLAANIVPAADSLVGAGMAAGEQVAGGVNIATTASTVLGDLATIALNRNLSPESKAKLWGRVDANKQELLNALNINLSPDDKQNVINALTEIQKQEKLRETFASPNLFKKAPTTIDNVKEKLYGAGQAVASGAGSAYDSAASTIANNKGTIAATAGGAAAALGLGGMLVKKIIEKNSWRNAGCDDIEIESEKTKCKQYVKNRTIKELQASLDRCSQANDPAKCKQDITYALEELNK